MSKDESRGRSLLRGRGAVIGGERLRRPTVFGRLGLGMLLVLSAFTGTVALGITTATPAFAAGTYTCTTPASGGTAVTFYTGVANSESVVCYGTSGVSGTTAYPASITVNTGSLPPGSTEATSTSSTPACTTSTSGTGTTEHYILTCPITDTPTSGQVGSYPVTFTANPGTDGGTAGTSGTLTVTVANTTQTCIDPASGGTSTTFYTGASNSYTVECEIETHVSGQSQYPSSIAITSGALPGDANQAFATSTSSSPACTQGTSSSGATEEYILECNLTATPTTGDVGSYPFTFTATGPPGTTTSGTLTVNVSQPTTTCSAPAAGGTATSFTVGTASSYSVTCYSQGFSTANAGNYPASITLASGALPSDATEATSLTSASPCTTATSGSGVAEEYELVCPVKETPTAGGRGHLYGDIHGHRWSQRGAKRHLGYVDADRQGHRSDLRCRPIPQRRIGPTFLLRCRSGDGHRGQRGTASERHHRRFRPCRGNRFRTAGREPGQWFGLRVRHRDRVAQHDHLFLHRHVHQLRRQCHRHHRPVHLRPVHLDIEHRLGEHVQQCRGHSSRTGHSPHSAPRSPTVRQRGPRRTTRPAPTPNSSEPGLAVRSPPTAPTHYRRRPTVTRRPIRVI